MGHEAGTRAEDGQIAAALLHLLELIVDDRLAQFVIANLQVTGFWLGGRILDARNFPISPILPSLRRRRVMAMYVDDHLALPRQFRQVFANTPACSFSDFVRSNNSTDRGNFGQRRPRAASTCALAGSAGRPRDGALRSSAGACIEATVA